MTNMICSLDEYLKNVIGRLIKINDDFIGILVTVTEDSITLKNVITHYIGIPLIIFGLISMLVRIPLGSNLFTVAEALIIVVTIYYFILDARLATVMLIAVLLLDILGRGISSFWIGFLIFAVGWLFQGIGHAVYEKHSPAFFKNLIHLLIGPLFLLNKLLHIRPPSV